jgi:hypothetical protein
MCIGDHGEEYTGNHSEHVAGDGYEQAPMLEFNGAIVKIEIDDNGEFFEFHMNDGGPTGDIELEINKSTPVANGEIRISNSANNDRTIIVTGEIEGNDLVIGDGVDVSGLTVDEESQIRISAWAPDTSVVIGDKTVHVMDDINVSITAESGATVIVRARNADVNVVNSLNEVAIAIAIPHVFKDDGGYKIHIGTGDSTGFTFTLMQGEATLEYTIDNQYAETEGKLHLVPSESIEVPNGINLEVQKDGITVIYEELEVKN